MRSKTVRVIALVLSVFVLAIFVINLVRHLHYLRVVDGIVLKPERDLYVIPRFLSATQYVKLKQIVLGQNQEVSLHRSKNLLRNGSSISHHKMRNTMYQGVLDIFQGQNVLAKIHHATHLDLQFAPLTDPNRTSLLFYTQPKDGIGWHYDGNNYYGNRWAGIYTIINQGKKPERPSSARFHYIEHGISKSIDTEPNSLVLFRGDKLKHKVDPIRSGERRVVLSSVFCDVGERTLNPFSLIYQSGVNLIFYGSI